MKFMQSIVEEVEKCDVQRSQKASGRKGVGFELLLDCWRKEMLSTGTQPRPSCCYYSAVMHTRKDSGSGGSS